MHKASTLSALGFEFHPWMKRILAVRSNRPAAYAVSVLLVLAALVIRWQIDPLVGAHVPFTTFYPAVFAAALIGGLGPAILATALAALAAWYIFMPPFLSFALDQNEDAELLLFIVVNSVNVFIATLISNMVDRLAAQQRNILILLESAPNGLAVVDENGLIILANTSLGKLLGYGVEELKGEPIGALVGTDPAEGPPSRNVARRNNGSVISVDLHLRPIEANKRPTQLASVVDLTAQRHVEESRRSFKTEVSQLDADYLATFGGIAGVLAKRAGTAQELADMIALRVERTARAIDRLSGAGATVSLRSLVNKSLVDFDGDDVELPVRLARRFAVILSELESNALQHGGLSTPEGQVIVRADIEGHWLMFLWAERGGPLSVRPGSGGFGTFVLQDLARQFGYDAVMHFGPRGFHYQLRVDLSELKDSREETGSAVDRAIRDRRRAAS